MIDEKKGKQYTQEEAKDKRDSKPTPLLFTASGDAIQTPETTDSTQCQKETSTKFLWQKIKSKDASFWQAIFTGLTVMGLIGYTYYTRRQWVTLNKSVTDSEDSFQKTLCQMKAQTAAQNKAAKAAEGANAIAEDALRSVQKAFVFFEKPDIAPLFDSSGNFTGMRLAPLWKNSGSTPAVECRSAVSAYWTPNMQGIPKDFGWTDYDFGTHAIPPGKGLATLYFPPQSTKYTRSFNIDPSMVSSIQERRARLYFYGWVRYRDVFKGTKPHTTMFCIEAIDFGIIPKTTAIIVPSDIRFDPCTEHNCVDDDCDKYTQHWPK